MEELMTHIPIDWEANRVSPQRTESAIVMKTALTGTVNQIERADIMAGYNLYIPTGRFSSAGTDNTSLGMWGDEFTIGSTVYLDPETGLWPRGYCKRNRFIDLDLAVVFDEPQFSEFVYEEIHAGTCRPDHACQSLLGNCRQDAVGLLLFS